MQSKELLAQKVAKRIIENPRKEHKKQTAKKLDYYYDNQKPYIDELLDECFIDNEQLSLKPQFVNITRAIVDEISMVYRAGAKRTIIGRNGKKVPKEAAALWAQLRKESKYDSVMKSVNRMVNLTKTVLVKPSVALERGRAPRLSLAILTPDMFDIIPDPNNPTEAEAIFYPKPMAGNENFATSLSNDSNRDVIYHIWSDSFYIRMTSGGEIIRDEANPDGINPYGIMPFARFTAEIPLFDYFVPGGDDLISAQESVNIDLIQLEYLLKMQSFSVPVLKGYEGENRIVVSPGRPIVIPADEPGASGAEFDFKSPEPHIREFLEAIEAGIRRIARSYGVSPESFTLTGAPKSGFALLMENYRLIEARENEVPFYEQAEERLFEIIKRIYNYETGFSNELVPLPDDATVSVAIKDISLPKSTSERLAEAEFMLKNKLTTPVEMIADIYNIPQREAEKIYNENKKWWDTQEDV